MKAWPVFAIACLIAFFLDACSAPKTQTISDRPAQIKMESRTETIPPKAIRSAAQIKINPIDPAMRDQIRSWGMSRNQIIKVQDSLLVWGSVGQRGDSASVSPSGIVRIFSFEPIEELGDIDKFYSSFSSVYQSIYDGSGGSWPTKIAQAPELHRDRLWDSTLVVFAPRQNTYKRLIVRELGFPYFLGIPNCPVKEGRIRLIARYSWAPYDKQMGFLFGTSEIYTKTLISGTGGRVSTDDIPITPYCITGKWRLDLRKSTSIHLGNPFPPRKPGQSPEPEKKMVIEFLLDTSCDKYFEIIDGNARSKQDATPCRSLEELIASHQNPE